MVDRIIQSFDVWTEAQGIKSRGRVKSIDNTSLEGIAHLRELILELAIQGKLIAQDPNDESASELVKRIEKEKLIKEGKLKREKHLLKIEENEKPYELPEGWVWVKLGLLSEIRGGKRLPSGHSFSPMETPYIYIQVTNMKNGTILANELKYISKETQSQISRYTINKEDLYITIAGTIGDVGIVPDSFDRMNLTENAAKIVFKLINKNWLQRVLSSRLLQNQFIKKTNQLAQPKLALHRIENAVIPLCPLAEQQRIVAKVDELMALCDKLEDEQTANLKTHQLLVKTLLQTLTEAKEADELQEAWQLMSSHFDTLFCTEDSIDQLKQTLLQLAIMGRLVKQDPDDEPARELLKRVEQEKAKLVKEGTLKKEKPLPEIEETEKPFALPQGWEWVRLGDIAKLVTKGSSPNWQGIAYTENPNDVLFITSENVGSYCLILDKLKYVERKFNEIEPRSILEKGDYLMNIVGGSIGRTAIYDIDSLANINQAVCLIRVFMEFINPQYLLHFFNSDVCISYMFDKQVDNARANLSMGNISKFIIPIPPLPEQKRIVNKVAELMALCDNIKSKIQEAGEIKVFLSKTIVENAVA